MRGKLWAVALAGASLSTLCPSWAHAQPAKPPAESAATVAESRFFAGQKLYTDKSYEKALEEFRASYQAVPSPNSRLYIARCLRQLGRMGAAYEEFSRVILEAADRMVADPKYEATQKAASAERAMLKDKVATVAVTMPADVPGAKLFVAGDEVPAAKWSTEITVTAGDVQVRAEAPGRTPFERMITLPAGQSEHLAAELPPAPLAPPSAPPPRVVKTPDVLRPVAYATAGVGVVGLVLWGAFGLKASSRFSGLQKVCGGRCGPEHQGEVDAGRKETTISRAGLGLGIVGVLGGATLWTVDYVSRKNQLTVGSVTVKLAASPLAPGAFVEGSF
jgi:hypothetical protein